MHWSELCVGIGEGVSLSPRHDLNVTLQLVSKVIKEHFRVDGVNVVQRYIVSRETAKLSNVWRKITIRIGTSEE